MANMINFRSEVEFGVGDTIRVHQTVTEGAKTRTQVFEGIVIRIRGHKGLKSFTVRKITVGGIGVERIFPENAPVVTKIEVKKKGKVKRAVLTYLRGRIGKKATKIQDKFVKGDWSSEDTKETVVVNKDEAEEITPEQRKLMKALAEEKAEKAAKKAEKEKKKSKKKAKLQRKERVFVR